MVEEVIGQIIRRS